MAMTSPFLLLALVAIGALIWAALKEVRNPLRKVPGPWYAAWTNLPLKLSVITGRRIHHVHALHQKYGPFVRIAPNEIAVDDLKSFKQIHGISSGFCKDKWYTSSIILNRQGVFNMIDTKTHASRRRLLARPFSKTYLREHWEGEVRQKVSHAIDAMSNELRSRGTADVLKWWTLMASDISSQLMFGDSFHTLEQGETNEYIRRLQNTLKGSGISNELPVVGAVLRRLPIQASKELFGNDLWLLNYGKAAVRNMKAAGGGKNIFANIMAEAEKGERIDDLDVQVEATNLIVAGTDTTAITLTYLVWAVLTHTHVRQQLEDEVRELPEDYKDADLERLPYLNAVIDETLRLYGAAPGALPRAVPPAGVTLNDCFLPGGTTVTTQSFSLHRDPHLFPEPEAFLPARWTSKEKLNSISDNAKAAYSPFGAGSRTCLGIHLAYLELRLAAAEFFRKVSQQAVLAASATAKCMEQENFFLIAPAGHKCEIALKQEHSHGLDLLA